MMSLTSPGRTAPARRPVTASGTHAPRRRNASHSPGIRTTSPSAVQPPPAGARRGPQRAQPVHAEEVAGHEQRPRPAAPDHVQRLGPGEPRADRHQHAAGAPARPARPVPSGVVRAPRRPPGHRARRPPRSARRPPPSPARPVAVAEPGAAGPGSASASASPNSLAAHATAAGIVSSTGALQTLLASKCLVGLPYAPGAAPARPTAGRPTGGPGAVHAAGRTVPRRGARVARRQPGRRVRRPARRGRPGPRARTRSTSGWPGTGSWPRRAGPAWAGRPSSAAAAPRWPSRSSSTRSTPGPARPPGSPSWARNCSGPP